MVPRNSINSTTAAFAPALQLRLRTRFLRAQGEQCLSCASLDCSAKACSRQLCFTQRWACLTMDSSYRDGINYDSGSVDD